MNRPALTIATLLSVHSAAALLCGCGGVRSERPVAMLTGGVMGTSYLVKVVDRPPALSDDELHEQVGAILARIDSRMSTFRPDSEVTRFNRHDGTDWFSVSAETTAVVEEAMAMHRRTGGAFDATVGPLVDLWSFGPGGKAPGTIPPAETIQTVLQRVGAEKLGVRSSPPAIRKQSADLQLDLSALAKGYAVDRVAEHLDGLGIRSYLVEVGGEVRSRGVSPRGTKWRIGIESPRSDTRTVHRVMALSGGAMATSGDYRNYFEVDGQRYCHLLDPRSGYPIRHRLASVTVLSPTCMRADAWATALMVLGPKEGYDLALERELPVMMIVKTDSGFIERFTPAFEGHPAP